MQGSIPYVPFLRAPYYIWIGRVPQLSTILAEPKTEAPSGFPATFLYTMSWEDPRPDMQVRHLCTGISKTFHSRPVQPQYPSVVCRP